MESTNKKQVPVMEGLFNWPSPDPHLIGNRCKQCGQHYFPVSFKCQNPDCMSNELEQVLLSNRGKLWSYTFEYFPPPAPFKAPKEGFKPFALGEVEFPEKIRIAGMMIGVHPDDDLHIGMDIDVVIDELYENEKGEVVLGWKFRPVM